jgi:hypothetical protein
VLALEEGHPPRVVALELGSLTLARRLHPWLESWLRRWVRRRPLRPYRIPLARVRLGGTDIVVDTVAERTPALAWERWLRRHIIGRIPGS